MCSQVSWIQIEIGDFAFKLQNTTEIFTNTTEMLLTL